MIEKPEHFGAEHAQPFRDASVAALFTILAGLVAAAPRAVLDVDCGIGDIPRPLAELVVRVDAVDFSREMIAHGTRLHGGDRPTLHWIEGPIEQVPLHPPYVLVTAGESLHWLDWNRVFPRFRAVLAPGGYLALVERVANPDPWSVLGALVSRYRIDGGSQPYVMIEEFERHSLFHKIGEWRTAPVRFVQAIDDFFKSYHSRERMGAARAASFERETSAMLRQSYPDGMIPLQVAANVIWERPLG